MPGWAIPVVVVGGFVLCWVSILWLIALISGWRRLAHTYPATEPFNGHLKRWQSVQFGFSGYNGCVAIGSSADGLYLAVMLPFRPGHPPLFVPWGEVASAEFVSKWYGSWLELRFTAAPRVRVRLPERVGKLVAADANRSWAGASTGVE